MQLIGPGVAFNHSEREGACPAMSKKQCVSLSTIVLMITLFSGCQKEGVAGDAQAAGDFASLEAHGLQPAHEPIHGTFSRESGFYSARRLIDSGAEFDGIFAGNDAIAVGLAAELQAQQLVQAAGAIRLAPHELRRLRITKRESQEKFWGRFGVTQSSGSRFETGLAIPAPVSRTVATMRSPEAAVRVAISIRPGFPVDAIACSAFITMLRNT